MLYDFEPRLVVAIKQFVRDAARRSLVGKFQRLRPKPLGVDDGNDGVGEDAAHRGVGSEVFEPAHASVHRLLRMGRPAQRCCESFVISVD